MRKPVVAVDIDDVLLEGVPVIVADYNRRFGTRVTPGDLYAAEYNRQVWGDVDIATASRRIDAYAESSAFTNREPVREVTHCLRALAKRYELHVLTGRNDVVTELTNDWLRCYFPEVFASVNFSNLFDPDKKRSKGEMCVELGASFLIDDHLPNVKSAAEYGLRAVLFGNYPWNQADELPPGVTRCADWPAVLEYFDGAS